MSTRKKLKIGGCFRFLGYLPLEIKFLRLRKGLTQAVLAEKVGISVIFLSSIERGTKYPKADTVSHLAKNLEVEVFELFVSKEVPAHQTMIKHLSNDIKKNINTLLDNIFKQYST